MGIRSIEIFERQREEARKQADENAKRYKEEQRKKRKTFTKKERQAVYNKCHGHCAYCGCEIDIKDMQIDHIVSVGWSAYGGMESQRLIDEGKMNDIDNLLPACRQCNFYKGMSNIESFRARIRETLWNTCTDTFQARLAIKYGMVTKHEWDGKFYFEKICNQ